MYRFSLESVLNHRRHTEDLLQKAFVHKKRELHRAEEELKALEKIKEENLSTLKQKQAAGAGISTILIYDSYIKQMSIRLKEQRHTIAELKNQLTEKRMALVEAMKQRKTLERLKEKERLVYKKALEKKDQIFLGDIAVNRFHRKMQTP